MSIYFEWFAWVGVMEFVASHEVWSYEKQKGKFGRKTNKCNQFVSDIANTVGAPVPNINGNWPPQSQDWANPKRIIPGWEIVTDPQPGDIIAEAHDYSDATGHVGIVTGDMLTTSVSSFSGKVVENNWGFRPGNNPVFRRFVGQ